ncbi:MAG: FAD-dependent oxidoreductase, partial [Bacilli bacterium]
MYDIIILGAGPGGYELALEASKKGLKVALVEAD